MLKAALFIFAMTLVQTRAQARVFDLNTEKFSAYFLASGGPSNIKKNLYTGEVSPTVTYDKQVDLNYGGEFGFVYSTAKASVLFGFEIFKPQSLSEVTGSSGGSNLYSLKSEITAYAPKIGVELSLQKTAAYRVFASGYVGSASLTYKNDYTMLNYSTSSNHSEEGKATGTLFGGGLGFEGLLSDTTTYVFTAGYRQLNFDGLKYSKDVSSSMTGASKASGDPVTDSSGNARTLNFSGLYLSVGFRFYL